METKVFDLSEIKDTNNKITRLADYQTIKRRFFELAKPIVNGDYSISKFHEEYIIPFTPEGTRILYQETLKWSKQMLPHATRLTAMIDASTQATAALTMLEREQDKLKKQMEIRQDVTDAMHSYIKQLKAYVEDPELSNKVTHKEMLELYRIIREEEDRAKGLSLKERAENRADAAFAWMVSQAKAGQLEEADISMLEDDIKKDLLVFKQQNGIFQLPVGAVPTIKSAAKNSFAQPGQSPGQGAA